MDLFLVFWDQGDSFSDHRNFSGSQSTFFIFCLFTFEDRDLSFTKDQYQDFSQALFYFLYQEKPQDQNQELARENCTPLPLSLTNSLQKNIYLIK